MRPHINLTRPEEYLNLFDNVGLTCLYLNKSLLCGSEFSMGSQGNGM